MAYGNGIFVAVVNDHTDNSYWHYTSTDGITWTRRTLTFTMYGGLIFDGTKFWRIGVTATTPSMVYGYAHSTDGINWTTGTISGITGAGFDSAWGNLFYDNGIYSVDGTTNYGVNSDNYFSTNGTTWTRSTTPTIDYYWKNVAAGGGKIAKIGYGGGANAPCYYTTDGVNWTSFTLPSGVSRSSIYDWRMVYAKSLFWVMDSSKVWVSSDLQTWTQMTNLIPNNSATHIIYYNNKIISLNNQTGNNTVGLTAYASP